MPNVQENCRKNVTRMSARMSARMKRNVLEKVLGHTSAVLLWLRIDRRCLKYKGKRMRNDEKGKAGGCESGTESDLLAVVLHRWSSREGG